VSERGSWWWKGRVDGDNVPRVSANGQEETPVWYVAVRKKRVSLFPLEFLYLSAYSSHAMGGMPPSSRRV